MGTPQGQDVSALLGDGLRMGWIAGHLTDVLRLRQVTRTKPQVGAKRSLHFQADPPAQMNSRRDQRAICFTTRAAGRPCLPSTTPVPLRKPARSSRAGIRIMPQARRASVCGSAAALRSACDALCAPLRLRSTFPLADRRPKPECSHPQLH